MKLSTLGRMGCASISWFIAVGVGSRALGVLNDWTLLIALSPMMVTFVSIAAMGIQDDLP